MPKRRGAKMAAYRDRMMQRDRKVRATQKIDVAAAAIARSGSFNVCYLGDEFAAKAARRLARTVVRALERELLGRQL